MKIVVNKCYGGYGLSDEAYLWLAKEYGIPIREHVKQERGEDGLYKPQPLNDGEVIFDRELTPPGTDSFSDLWHKYKGRSSLMGRYWDSDWTRKRDDPRIVACVEALGDKANGRCAKLRVVEIPDGVEWELDEYDGIETVREKSRVFG